MFLAEAFFNTFTSSTIFDKWNPTHFLDCFYNQWQNFIGLLIKKEQKKNYLKDNRVDGILEYMFKDTRKISNEIG